MNKFNDWLFPSPIFKPSINYTLLEFGRNNGSNTILRKYYSLVQNINFWTPPVIMIITALGFVITESYCILYYKSLGGLAIAISALLIWFGVVTMCIKWSNTIRLKYNKIILKDKYLDFYTECETRKFQILDIQAALLKKHLIKHNIKIPYIILKSGFENYHDRVNYDNKISATANIAGIILLLTVSNQYCHEIINQYELDSKSYLVILISILVVTLVIFKFVIQLYIDWHEKTWENKVAPRNTVIDTLDHLMKKQNLNIRSCTKRFRN